MRLSSILYAVAYFEKLVGKILCSSRSAASQSGRVCGVLSSIMHLPAGRMVMDDFLLDKDSQRPLDEWRQVVFLQAGLVRLGEQAR